MLRLGQATLRSLSQAGQSPVEAIVDEATGQVEQEVAFHTGNGALDVESVIEDAVENGLADEVVVLSLGANVGHPGAKRTLGVDATPELAG